MKINHTVAHYVIGGAALAFSVVNMASGAKPLVLSTPPGIHSSATPARLDWPSLGEEKSIALGESLKDKAPGAVTIFCSVPSCHAFAADLDDAFQIAGWKSDSEERPVDSEADPGVSVGPPGQNAENLADAIEKVTGSRPAIVGISGFEGVGVIIGKHGAAK